jgi:hypothetical protein
MDEYVRKKMPMEGTTVEGTGAGVDRMCPPAASVRRATIAQSSPDAVVGRYLASPVSGMDRSGFNPRPTLWSGATVELINPEIARR